jgi:hypothetical protein
VAPTAHGEAAFVSWDSASDGIVEGEFAAAGAVPAIASAGEIQTAATSVAVAIRHRAGSRWPGACVICMILSFEDWVMRWRPPDGGQEKNDGLCLT